MPASPAAYRPNPDVVATELDDAEAVLLHLKTRRYYSLNDTGTRIWQLIQDGRDTRTMVDAIMQEWEIEQAEAEQQVTAFVEELVREGLVERVEP